MASRRKPLVVHEASNIEIQNEPLENLQLQMHQHSDLDDQPVHSCTSEDQVDQVDQQSQQSRKNKIASLSALQSFPQNPKISKNLKQIQNHLSIYTWIWDPEEGHKLFNFHQGYELIPTFSTIVGSNIIYETSKGDLNVKQARHAHTFKIDSLDYKKRCLNIIYDRETYYLYQPKLLKNYQLCPIDQTVTHAAIPEIKDRMWHVLKFKPKRQIRVNLGDVLRFGRVCFKVTDMCMSKDSDNDCKAQNKSKLKGASNQNSRVQSLPNDQSILTSHQNVESNGMFVNNTSVLDQTLADVNQTILQDGDDLLDDPNLPIDSAIGLAFKKKKKSLTIKQIVERKEQAELHQTGRVCRICLEDDESAENPFIEPCKCHGSCKYIHLKCLQSWIDGRCIKSDHYGVRCYYWEDLTCELCKTPLKEQFDVTEDLVLPLLEWHKPIMSDCYLVLQSEVPGNSKAIFVVDFTLNNSIQVGRRASNEISISDISVSRDHAKVVYLENENQIVIQDQDSKFGTFVAVQNGLLEIQTTQKQNQIDSSTECSSKNEIAVQIGQKCFFVKQSARFSSMSRCFQCCWPTNYKSKSEQKYDHFTEVYQKYPQDILKILYPQIAKKQQQQIPKLLQKSKQRKPIVATASQCSQTQNNKNQEVMTIEIDNQELQNREFQQNSDQQEKQQPLEQQQDLDERQEINEGLDDLVGEHNEQCLTQAMQTIQDQDIDEENKQQEGDIDHQQSSVNIVDNQLDKADEQIEQYKTIEPREADLPEYDQQQPVAATIDETDI